MVMEVGMQRPLICLKTFLGSEMCVNFVVPIKLLGDDFF